MFYTLSQHFGTRGRQEHHQIKAEELKFVKNALTGETEYVEWVEGLTDTPGRIGEKGKTSFTTSLLRTVKAASSSRKHSKRQKPLGYYTYYLCKTVFLLFLLHMYVFLKY